MNDRTRIFRAIDKLRDQQREGWHCTMPVLRALTELVALQESRRPCDCKICDDARTALIAAVLGEEPTTEGKPHGDVSR